MNDVIQALYLHIPFCASRCHYCDFTTEAIEAESPLMDSYVESLIAYIRTLSKADLTGGIETIYLGGGTPSFLGSKRLTSLVYALTTSINLNDKTEFTIEVNPDSFNEALLKDLWALGVNRYSVGVQSFDDEVLKILGRRHDATAAKKALELLAAREANFSVDLMCGIPGQSLDSWKQSVETAIASSASHVSIYPLSVEPGTWFAQQIRSGQLPSVNEDMQVDMMLAARDMLQAAGIMRYEVSNYARNGFESRHNKAYWTGKQYLGLGTGASSMVSDATFSTLFKAGLVKPHFDPSKMSSQKSSEMRFACMADPEKFAQLDAMPVEVDQLDERETLCEQLLLRMRMTDGIGTAELMTCENTLPGVGGLFAKMVADGLLKQEKRFILGDESNPSSSVLETYYTATERGWLMGNEIDGRIWHLSSAE